jgi:hypothetical protein
MATYRAYRLGAPFSMLPILANHRVDATHQHYAALPPIRRCLHSYAKQVVSSGQVAYAAHWRCIS